MNDLVASFIRTWVPVAVTALATWLADIGVLLPDDAQTGLVAAVGGLIGAAYYALVRALEHKFPWVGAFLGTAKAPIYVSPGDVSPAKTPETVATLVNKADNVYQHRNLA